MNRRPPKRAKGAPRAPLASLRDGRGAAPTLPTSSGHRARTFAVSTMITREPTRNDMVQRRRARPRGLRGCAEPLGGLSRRLDAQRAFRSSNTSMSRVWLTLPPAAAALLALPVQKLNRFDAIFTGPRCFGVQLHARLRSVFWAEADKLSNTAAELYGSPRPSTGLRTTGTRR